MQAAQPGRTRLPNRRRSETFSLQSEGLSYTATVSYFADGRVAEIFLSNHKAGSAADVTALSEGESERLAERWSRGEVGPDELHRIKTDVEGRLSCQSGATA